MVQRGQEELHTGNLPPLHPSVSQLDRYDTLLVGTPNWFGTIAPPVQTFLNDSDLAGKRVAPFCTNGGGGFGTIPQDLERMCPASICLPGLQVSGSGVSEEQLSHWLRQIGVL